MTDASEAARQLAARRPRATFVCTVCGREFVALVRKTQPAQTCSTACRQRLQRQRRAVAKRF